MRWVAVDDDQPHSPLNRVKASSSNPSIGGMKRLLARLELIEATGVLGVDVDWVNGNYQRILFHSVRTASSRPGAQDGGPTPSPRAGALPALGWRDLQPVAQTMQQPPLPVVDGPRQAGDRIVQRYLPAQRRADERPPARRPPGRQ